MMTLAPLLPMFYPKGISQSRLLFGSHPCRRAGAKRSSLASASFGSSGRSASWCLSASMRFVRSCVSFSRLLALMRTCVYSMQYFEKEEYMLICLLASMPYVLVPLVIVDKARHSLIAFCYIYIYVEIETRFNFYLSTHPVPYPGRCGDAPVTALLGSRKSSKASMQQAFRPFLSPYLPPTPHPPTHTKHTHAFTLTHAPTHARTHIHTN